MRYGFPTSFLSILLVLLLPMQAEAMVEDVLEGLADEAGNTLGTALLSGAGCALAAALWPHDSEVAIPDFNVLAELRQGQQLQIVLSQSDTLNASFSSFHFLPESEYVQLLDLACREMNCGPLPITVGEAVLVPGTYKAGRRAVGRFCGFSRGGVLFEYELRSAVEFRFLPSSKEASIDVVSGVNVDLGKWLKLALPAREVVTVEVDGESRQIGADEIENLIILDDGRRLFKRSMFAFLAGAIAGPILLP